jgi:uncharacterized RDD family membrane protein YckC
MGTRAIEVDSGEHDELVTGEAVALDLRPTPFVLRAAGCIIDLLVSGLLYVGIVLVIASPAVSPYLDGATGAILTVSGLVVAFVVLPTAVETATRGRSLGRLAVGARIVRLDGGAIGFRHAFVRALVGVLEILMTFGGLAAAVGLLTRRSQRLGDLIAGVYSQHERIQRPASGAFGLPPGMEAWAQVADVARMPTALGNRIAAFLRQAGDMTPSARTARGAELLAEASPFITPLPNAPAEVVLAAASVVRRDRELAALRSRRAGLERLDALVRGGAHGFPRR